MGILPCKQQYDVIVMQYNSAVGDVGQQYNCGAVGQYAVEIGAQGPGVMVAAPKGQIHLLDGFRVTTRNAV